MSKTLVLYAFHIFNDRCQNFIDKCIFEDPNVDFMIISNDKNAKFEAPLYVKKIFRDNIGYDFGAWSEGLLTNDLYKGYGNFIFLNSSVIGPFLRDDFKGKWTDIYLNGLKGDVKLFGTTINTMDNPRESSHVQSYIFAVDIDTLKYLIDENIFSITNYAKSFDEAIKYKEILMSRKIIEKGWNIGSLFLLYQDVDFRFKTKPPENYNIKFLDDVMFNKFFGYLWTEYQLVFLKGNRDLEFAPHNKKSNIKGKRCDSKYYLLLLTFFTGIVCLNFRSNKNILFFILFVYLLILLYIITEMKRKI